MNERYVLRADHGPVVVLTLNRPERRNALSRVVIDELGDALSRVAVEPDGDSAAHLRVEVLGRLAPLLARVFLVEGLIESATDPAEDPFLGVGRCGYRQALTVE